MEFQLSIADGKIREAAFMTDGCGVTVACGSKLTGMITGMDLEAVSGLTNTDLERALGGLPPEDRHCAVLAINTLHATTMQTAP